MTGGSAAILVEDVHHAFETRSGPVAALEGVDLEIAPGEIFALVGPSGCGKSTLLNLIAGLEPVSRGRIAVFGRPVVAPGPDRGVVFQQYALFPWMTVRQNVEFGLKLQGVRSAERRRIADEYLELVGLSAFADAWPKELSGGMKQRAALARAYAVRPRVLLMDEPFGALDAQTRSALQCELLAAWAREHTTILFITHDVEEAAFVAQRVGVMTARPGRLRETISVGLPYPRDEEVKMDPAFAAIKKRIWLAVREESSRAGGLPARGPSSSPGATPSDSGEST